jgi:hypothetical protein
MKFQDIPQFTRSASYQVNVSWRSLERQLEQFNDRNGMLDLDPDFQRGHVWSPEKQIAYVEFILRGGNSSKTLQFNCSSWQREYNTPLQLVDGKQRLEAVRKFLRNELPIFGGSFLADFTDELPHCQVDFIFCVNNLKTRSEVLQWYLELNSGGVVHTEEELNKVRKMLDDTMTYK